VYNKPNGCSATGALAPGPDHQQQPTKEPTLMVIRSGEFITQQMSSVSLKQNLGH
jgi:hypothetical protein